MYSPRSPCEGEDLGLIVNETGKPIESAIALVYPESVLDLNGQGLRDELGRTDAPEYALLTRTIAEGKERLLASGWLSGSAKDLALLAHLYHGSRNPCQSDLDQGDPCGIPIPVTRKHVSQSSLHARTRSAPRPGIGGTG